MSKLSEKLEQYTKDELIRAICHYGINEAKFNLSLDISRLDSKYEMAIELNNEAVKALKDGDVKKYTELTKKIDAIDLGSCN